MNNQQPSAPDPMVTLADGSSRPLSEFWQDRALVLVFLRHFG